MAHSTARKRGPHPVLVDRVVSAVEQLPRWGVWTVALIGTAAVGLADFATGAELSLSIFYLLPVGVVAWRSHTRAAVAMSALAATVWLVADLTRSTGYNHSSIPFWNSAVRLGFFVIVSVLLVRVRDALATERERATIDQATGIANGRAFRAALDREVERARRYRHPITVGYLDLDDFKDINDRYGHHAGDELLSAVAAALNSKLRATDLAARLGGDEFAVLLTEAGMPAAEAAFAKIAAELASITTPNGLRVRASIGVVVCPAAPASGDALLREADATMYRAKGDGGNRLLFATSAAAVLSGPS